MKKSIFIVLASIFWLIPQAAFADKMELHQWTTIKLGNADESKSNITFSPDGELVATGHEDNYVRLWDADSAQLVKRIPSDYGVKLLTFSPDGKRLAFISYDSYLKGALYIFDIASETVIHKIDLRYNNEIVSKITRLVFSSDGYTLYADNGSRDLYFWDVLTGQELLKLEFPNQIKSFTYDENNHMIAVADWKNTIHIRSAKTGAFVKTVSDVDADEILYTPDANFLIGRNTVTEPSQLIMLNVKDGYKKVTLEDNQFLMNPSTQDMEISADGKFLITSSSLSDSQIFDTETGEELATFHPSRASDNIALHPALSMLVANSKYEIYYFDASELKNFKKLESIGASKTSFELMVNDKQSVDIIGKYSNDSEEVISFRDVTWETSDFNVAIMHNGAIVARGAGQATLTGVYKEKRIEIKVVVKNSLPHDPTGFTKWASKTNVSIKKQWNIAFNLPVDGRAITEQNIYITDRFNQMVPLSVTDNGQDNSKIVVSPAKPYENGQTYTLWIREIKGTNGKILSQNVMMDFTVEN